MNPESVKQMTDDELRRTYRQNFNRHACNRSWPLGFNTCRRSGNWCGPQRHAHLAAKELERRGRAIWPDTQAYIAAHSRPIDNVPGEPVKGSIWGRRGLRSKVHPVKVRS